MGGISGGGGGPGLRASAQSVGAQSLTHQLSTSSHVAAAVLREASIQSHRSYMPSNSDADDMDYSPGNSEVEGYEDILSEDAIARASRRASYCLDRAHSREGSGGTQDSVDHYSSTGGSPGRKHHGTAGSASRENRSSAMQDLSGGKKERSPKRRFAPRGSSPVGVFLPAREYPVEDSAEVEQGGYFPDHSNGGGSGSRPGSSSSSRARAGGTSDNLPSIEGDRSGEVSAPRSSRNKLPNGDDFKEENSPRAMRAMAGDSNSFQNKSSSLVTAHEGNVPLRCCRRIAAAHAPS